MVSKLAQEIGISRQSKIGDVVNELHAHVGEQLDAIGTLERDGPLHRWYGSYTPRGTAFPREEETTVKVRDPYVPKNYRADFIHLLSNTTYHPHDGTSQPVGVETHGAKIFTQNYSLWRKGYLYSNDGPMVEAQLGTSQDAEIFKLDPEASLRELARKDQQRVQMVIDQVLRGAVILGKINEGQDPIEVFQEIPQFGVSEEALHPHTRRTHPLGRL